MDAILINSKISKISEPHKLLFNFSKKKKKKIK